MTTLLLQPATLVSTAIAPSLDTLEGLDADALSAVADALLAANEKDAAVQAGRESQAEPSAAIEESTPVDRPRGRRRGPVDCSPEGLAAREAMITQHMPLVRYVANSMARHAGQSVLLDYDDLLSYGTEGLIAAVDTFDVSRGLKFSTWAVMHIRTTIQDALRTLDPLPRSLRAKGKEIDRVSATLAHQRGQWPEVTEVAAALGQPLDVLRKTMQDLGQTVVSLEQADDGHSGSSTSGDDNGYSLLNLLADHDPETSPEEKLDQTELSRLLAEAIASLPAREEVLINAHYRQGLSMRTISKLLNISESRVSQLHARAVKLLREHLDRALSLDPVQPERRTNRRMTTLTRRLPAQIPLRQRRAA